MQATNGIEDVLWVISEGEYIDVTSTKKQWQSWRLFIEEKMDESKKCALRDSTFGHFELAKESSNVCCLQVARSDSLIRLQKKSLTEHKSNHTDMLVTSRQKHFYYSYPLEKEAHSRPQEQLREQHPPPSPFPFLCALPSQYETRDDNSHARLTKFWTPHHLPAKSNEIQPAGRI